MNNASFYAVQSASEEIVMPPLSRWFTLPLNCSHDRVSIVEVLNDCEELDGEYDVEDDLVLSLAAAVELAASGYDEYTDLSQLIAIFEIV
jgi:hypothetical protein